MSCQLSFRFPVLEDSRWPDPAWSSGRSGRALLALCAAGGDQVLVLNKYGKVLAGLKHSPSEFSGDSQCCPTVTALAWHPRMTNTTHRCVCWYRILTVVVVEGVVTREISSADPLPKESPMQRVCRIQFVGCEAH
ncbi:tetratricopeptide repeat-containing protein [Cystoisospora suis]|uniref:Tetratricopeptide repeat-containing protein n=1 Tax=Cystoisospora suis TaxID=483139 RepID=A0A2C6L609_9APIC|nr:tetratricopeptide repeat-containing protein [Cystoisospora suis]